MSPSSLWPVTVNTAKLGSLISLGAGEHRKKTDKQAIKLLLCSAWLLYWCSYLEPSCSATVWRASGWGRSGGGGGRLPASSSPLHWFALKWVQQMSFSILSFLKQATLLLSQSQRMVGMNIRITACEAAFESLLQLSLQLYIIFLRSDTLPSALQVDKSTLKDL